MTKFQPGQSGNPAGRPKGTLDRRKIFRELVEPHKNDLIKKNDISTETGRPKHLYFLSKQGESKLNGLIENLGKYFDFMKERFPVENKDFDHLTFLREATFKVWSSPVEHIIQSDIPNKEKIESLERMESDLDKMLEKIRKEKKKLLTIQNDKE